MIKKYQIIYADPPWTFIDSFWDRSQSNPSAHYNTMTLEQIKNLPVLNIADDNCHLYLWTTSRHLMNGESIAVLKTWGFDPMNIITWVKPQISLGYYFRNSTEHLLFGVRGRLHTIDRKQPTHIIANRETHSRKPLAFADMIVRCSGDLPRIELFARRKAMGWDCWGNEVESDIELGV